MHDTTVATRPGRILYVITRALLGGAQTHLLSLLRRAHVEGECGLIVGNEGPLTDSARTLGARVWVVPSLQNAIHPVRDWRATAEITRILRDFRPDLVHAHSSKAGTLARLAAKRAGVPAVFTAHGWAFTDGASRLRKLIGVVTERLMVPLSGRIVVVSEYDLALARRHGVGREGQVVLIRNGVPDVPHRADPGTGTPRIAMVARFSPPKDQPALIRALAALHAPAELLLIGGGELLAESQALAASLGVADRVHCPGDRTDVAELLAGSHICALISNYEGFPYAVLEGMRAGSPVVASDVGGVREAVVDGETGYLIPKGDDAVLLARLDALVRDPALRVRMGQAGRQRYLDYFTEERMLADNFAVYRELLPGKIKAGVS